MSHVFDEKILRTSLERAWSAETASQWSAENPANGQCNVTAVVVQELFGGELLRTRIGAVWHYYNRLDGKRVDLTDSQFTRPGARFDPPARYEDAPTDRAAAMEGVPERERAALRRALLAVLG